jgi:hypothetical protein
MTDAQNQILNEITDILKEHFEGSVLCVVNDADDGGDISSLRYTGGMMQAIGILTSARAKMVQTQCASLEFTQAVEDDDDEEEG